MSVANTLKGEHRAWLKTKEQEVKHTFGPEIPQRIILRLPSLMQSHPPYIRAFLTFEESGKGITMVDRLDSG